MGRSFNDLGTAVEGTQLSSNFHAARRRDTFSVMFATPNPTLAGYEALIGLAPSLGALRIELRPL